jgi:hypothetical protein
MNVTQHQEIERQVIRFTIKRALYAGYGLPVYNREEEPVINSTAPEFTLIALMTTGEHDLIVTNLGTNYAEGFIRFI